MRAFARIAERYCDTRCTRSGSPSDTVDIGFRLVWQLVVDYMGHIVDVDAACGNISCDKNARSTFAEILQGALSQVLRFVAMDGLGANAIFGKPPHDIVRASLCAGKDNDFFHLRLLEKLGQAFAFGGG